LSSEQNEKRFLVKSIVHQAVIYLLKEPSIWYISLVTVAKPSEDLVVALIAQNLTAVSVPRHATQQDYPCQQLLNALVSCNGA